MNPNLRGVIAESAIAAEAAALGFEVYAPMFGAPRCDLILGLESKLIRVQCKSATRDGDVVRVRAITNRRTSDGYLRGTYSADEVDVIAAYCPEFKQSFAVPIENFGDSGTIQLRLSEPRNGQKAGLHFAEDYQLGAIAQLGERPAGSREVVGSNPTSSTPLADVASSTTVGAHEFRNRFGWYMERAAAGEDILVTRRGKPHLRLSSAVMQPRLLAA
jgi:prevent-host-death family protein